MVNILDLVGHTVSVPITQPFSSFFKCDLSYLTPCNSMDCSLPGSSIHGISQGRILECVAISSSKGSSQLRKQTRVSCVSFIGLQFRYHCTTWEAQCYLGWRGCKIKSMKRLPKKYQVMSWITFNISTSAGFLHCSTGSLFVQENLPIWLQLCLISKYSFCMGKWRVKKLA